jgi:formylglycine-generating enzyme required for sulfatase activity
MKTRLFVGKRTAWLLAGLLSLSTAFRMIPAASAQDESRKSARPSESTEEMLERFVDECVSITPGEEQFPKSFTMGGGAGPLALEATEITLSTPFRISRYEMTQELYELVMTRNPSRWQGRRNSVEMVSWLDATQFCQRLTTLLQTQKLIGTTETVRLPTEAEWEYCCRAGSKTQFSFGDSAVSDGDQENIASVLNDYAWHTGNAAGNDPAVGVLKPNAWGLYDMHGYLWEYVQNSGTRLPSADFSNASSPISGATNVIRGGSWRDHYSLLTSSSRLSLPNHAMSDAIGFRCVLASGQ